MGAIPVNFQEFQKCYFAFKYGCGSHLEFRLIAKMSRIFQRYLGAKFLQKDLNKRKMLRYNVSFQIIKVKALLIVVKLN